MFDAFSRGRRRQLQFNIIGVSVGSCILGILQIYDCREEAGGLISPTNFTGVSIARGSREWRRDGKVNYSYLRCRRRVLSSLESL